MQKRPNFITRDLSVFRSAFVGEELEHLGLEIDELWESWPGIISRPMNGEIFLVTDEVPLTDITLRAGGVLEGIVEICDIPEDSEVGLNTYQPHRTSMFHTHDRERSTIVHPTGDGAFDIAPHADNLFKAEAIFNRLTVNAGDIVMSSGEILHRGANLGNTLRRNLVFLHD